MKIALIALSGVRAYNEELTRLGMTLPGFVERSKVIASLPSLSLLTIAGVTPKRFDVEYHEVADIRNLDAQIVMQQSAIDQAEAEIAAAEATLKFAQEDHARYQGLMKTGYGTVQRAQQAESSLQQNGALLQRDRAALVGAQKQIAVLKTQRAKAETVLEHNRAVRQQAALDLSYAVVAAPIDGTVGARSLRVGQYVQAGTQLMAVVPLQAVYVVANFKETQLTHLRPGQEAEITVDTFPGTPVRGHVESVAPASGQEFALLPPDNATGNFTKIVQRIPVKIVLDANDALAGRLRAGMSVEPVIDTHAIAEASVASSENVATR